MSRLIAPKDIDRKEYSVRQRQMWEAPKLQKLEMSAAEAGPRTNGDSFDSAS